MLEFIVLGQIPGTSIQITFTQLLKLALVVVVIILVRFELHLRKVQPLKLQDVINRLAL